MSGDPRRTAVSHPHDWALPVSVYISVAAMRVRDLRLPKDKKVTWEQEESSLT